MRRPIATGPYGQLVIWAILAALGVPLWLCAAGISLLVLRNRSLRKRAGDIPVRMRTGSSKRWHRGHAVWVHDVFVFRGSPAAWKEELLPVMTLTIRAADPDQARGPKGLHRLGDKPVIASLSTDDGNVVEFAARDDDRTLLEGPFGASKAGPIRIHASA